MSYEYVFHTPRYKQLDKGLIEEKVRLLPHAFECNAKNGSGFYIVAGDEETKNFVQKMVESHTGHLAVPELVDQVRIEYDKVWVSCCGSVNETLRIFCTWLVDEFGCSIEDEFDSPSSLEDLFPCDACLKPEASRGGSMNVATKLAGEPPEQLVLRPAKGKRLGLLSNLSRLHGRGCLDDQRG